VPGAFKKGDTFKSAEVVRTAEGRQYHIGLAPEDVAPTCILVGDPARAAKVASRFSARGPERRNREYVAITGTYAGGPLTVLATGIGCDNTEIAVIEYTQLVGDAATFIRCGSSGALRKEIALGDLVVSSAALRLENTSTWFVHEGFPAAAHPEVALALVEACEQARAPYHVGITACAPGFYGAQSRKVPGFPPRHPDLPADLERQGCANFEMETSTLFTLAALRGIRAGAVCAVFANRHANVFIDAETKERAEARAIDAALRAVTVLRGMDAARDAAGARRWRPSLGLAPVAIAVAPGKGARAAGGRDGASPAGRAAKGARKRR
jgi:uridine phosphorylase